MKWLPTLFIIFWFCEHPASAEQHVNQTGQIKISDLGDWKIKSDEITSEGHAKLKMQVPGENMHVEFKVFAMAEPFDVATPVFGEQIKANLTKAGMEVVASMQGSFANSKAYKVFAVQARPREERDLLIHVLSISAFFGSTFVTVSVADDNADVENNERTRHLLNCVSIIEG